MIKTTAAVNEQQRKIKLIIEVVFLCLTLKLVNKDKEN